MTQAIQSPHPIEPWLWSQVLAADAAGKLNGKSLENLRLWLGEPRYSASRQMIANLICQGKWAELDAAFWTTIPFGTAGRRGVMYPVGPNAINDRTMGESARGLADYLLELYPDRAGQGTLSVAIGYDTRHRSRHFAELCAEILTAVNIRVLFLDGFRATPELACTVRTKKCDAGIMITASHNPPSDNAIKVFWSDGAQIRPPFDGALIDRVNRVQDIPRKNFAVAFNQGLVKFVQEEMDRVYQAAVLKLAKPGPRELKILYSPLHGVGRTCVEPVLLADGISTLSIYGPQAEPDGNFPNVPGHVSNPENPGVFTDLITAAKSNGNDLILASDPDADRIGAACPESYKTGADWKFLTGNQIGVLLGECLLGRLKAAGQLTREHFIVKTLVTSNMLVRLAESYGCTAYGDVLTGFKWIGLVMDEHDPTKFVLGTEEAHGYLAGTHIRDKDAAVAAMLLAEFAAELKQQGKTLWQALQALYQRIGCFQERSFAVTLPGADGMDRMQRVIAKFRNEPPTKLGDCTVKQIRDYEQSTIRQLDPLPSGNALSTLIGPRADMMFFDLNLPGHMVAMRPSGTEPKLKFYLFSELPPKSSQDVPMAIATLQQRLLLIENDLHALVNAIP
jgi:phosphomannomutase